jgi:hypothetical protein
MHVFFAAAGGGIVRCFYGDRLVVEDLGIDLVDGDRTITSRVYDAARPVHIVDDKAQIDVPLSRTRFLSPGFWPRLVLRVGSSTAFTSRILRSAIDVYRTRKKTAINQSAASVGELRSGAVLSRSVLVSGSVLTITDSLRSRDKSLNSKNLRAHLSVDGKSLPVLTKEFSDKSTARITKRFAVGDSQTEASTEVEVTENP